MSWDGRLNIQKMSRTCQLLSFQNWKKFELASISPVDSWCFLSQIFVFVMFTLKISEDEAILTCTYFPNWCWFNDSTTNQVDCLIKHRHGITMDLEIILSPKIPWWFGFVGGLDSYWIPEDERDTRGTAKIPIPKHQFSDFSCLEGIGLLALQGLPNKYDHMGWCHGGRWCQGFYRWRCGVIYLTWVKVK